MLNVIRNVGSTRKSGEALVCHVSHGRERVAMKMLKLVERCRARGVLCLRVPSADAAGTDRLLRLLLREWERMSPSPGCVYGHRPTGTLIAVEELEREANDVLHQATDPDSLMGDEQFLRQVYLPTMQAQTKGVRALLRGNAARTNAWRKRREERDARSSLP